MVVPPALPISATSSRIHRSNRLESFKHNSLVTLYQTAVSDRRIKQPKRLLALRVFVAVPGRHRCIYRKTVSQTVLVLSV